jgi:hypothetical protein
MALNNLYLVNTSSSTQVLYFIDCLANAVQYAAELDILYVPSTMPAGYALPSGATWSLPATATYPQITLCDGLMKIFGFTSQSTCPLSQTVTSQVNLSFLSDTYPVLSPIFCYMLACNWINSPFNLIPGLFFQIPLTSPFGNLITQTLPNSAMTSCSPGKYAYFELQLYDQNLNPLILIDPEITITVLVQFSSK